MKRSIRDGIISKQDINYVHAITKELSLMGNDKSEYGFRVSGSSGEWNVSRRIEAEMKKIGLEDVTVEKFPVHSWEIKGGNLIVENVKMPMSSYCGIVGTPKEGISAEIVDVGKGTLDDYIGKDVKDKIVLCTFDILEDFWISLPVYQAESMGAKACIISYAGDFYGTREDAINSFDSQCKYGFPVGNISRKNAAKLREMLAKGPVHGKMALNIDVDFNGSSSNVIGYIPGEDPDKMILLGGHMDGYFHSYQDDLLGVGIILDIARTVIESGYKPRHTLVFIAHGSEEYGVTESRYDWCIGSWHNINNIHPEWAGKMIAFFNIDAIRPGTPVYNIASTPEYHGYFEEFMETMNVPKNSWPGGCALLGLNGPWSDDFNYAIKGVPGIICGRGPAEWSYQNYHTQFDDYTIFEAEKDIIAYVTSHYTDMLLAFDEFILPPLNFKYALTGINCSLNTIDDSAIKQKIDELNTIVEQISIYSDSIFNKVKKINANEIFIESSAIEDVRKKLLSVYKMIQGDLKKLSPWDDVVFAHDCVAKNLEAMQSAVEKINRNCQKDAVEDLWEADLFKVAYQFSSNTYDWLMECQDNKRNDLFWGTGKIHKFADVSTLVKALKDGANKLALSELAALIKFEEQQLQDIIVSEIDILKSALKKLESLEI